MFSSLCPKTYNKNEMDHNEHEEQQRTQSRELTEFPLCPL